MLAIICIESCRVAWFQVLLFWSILDGVDILLYKRLYTSKYKCSYIILSRIYQSCHRSYL